MAWLIYCHTHIESGRHYIGLTSRTMERRWSQHIVQARSSKGGRWHFPNAIRKYGPEAFSHAVLEFDIQTLEEANEAEEAWIESFSTRMPEFGFNLMRGGEHKPHPIGKNPWSDLEYREKASIAAKHRWRDPVIRAKNIASLKAVSSTPEARLRRSSIAKMAAEAPGAKLQRSKSALAMWEDPSYRAKIVASNTDKFMSVETRSKISVATAASNRVRVMTEATRSKIASSISSLYAVRTGINCRRHGDVSLSECYHRKSRSGNPGARLVCKQCVKEQNKRANIR